MQYDDKQLEKIQKTRNKFVRLAKARKLFDDYLFVKTFDAFETQLELMDGYKKKIDEKGVMIMAPFGSSGEKLAVNPAADAYTKACGIVTKLVSTLQTMIDKAPVPSDQTPGTSTKGKFKL